MTVKRLQNKVEKTLRPEDFINALNPKKDAYEVKVTLRIPTELLEMIDSSRATEFTKESRNTWILRSIRHQIDLKMRSM